MTANDWIDLRSDTVTRPVPGMREAMANAEVGDDVLGEDPTVRELEETLAGMTGLEAGLFMPSGTQSNLVALLTHCGRGDEYIVSQDAHTYRYEGGGAAVLGGIQPQPLERAADGTLDLEQVRRAIKAPDFHFARTRLLCLENTIHGQALPLDYMQRARRLTEETGLALHLDGARLFNAAAALDVPLAAISRHADTVSICLSKGLGAPVGSVLLGSAAFIREARRWRKVAGGGMRQAGILAAAGLYALTHHVERLGEDHRRAAELGQGLKDCGYTVTRQATNMVFLRVDEGRAQELHDALLRERIRVDVLDTANLRLVTHLHINDNDIERVTETLAGLAQAV